MINDTDIHRTFTLTKIHYSTHLITLVLEMHLRRSAAIEQEIEYLEFEPKREPRAHPLKSGDKGKMNSTVENKNICDLM